MLRIFFGDVKFDFGPLLQGQTRACQYKSAYISLIIGSRVSNVQLTFRKPYAANLLVMSDLTLDPSFKVKLWRVSIKVPLSCLLLVLEVCNVQSTFRKPYALHLLVMSNFTLDRSFKVKLGWVSIKVPISCLLLCHQHSWETYRDRSCDRRSSRRLRRRRCRRRCRRRPIFRLK